MVARLRHPGLEPGPLRRQRGGQSIVRIEENRSP